ELGEAAVPALREALADDDAEVRRRAVEVLRAIDTLPPGAVARLGTVRFRHQMPLCALCFSPDGKVLASTAWDGTLCFWDAADGRLRRKVLLPGDFPFICSLAFSADGKIIATAGGWEEGVYLWDVATGKRLHRFSHPVGRLAAIAVSPDGKLVATGESEAIVVWDATTGKELRRFPGMFASQSLVFSGDGRTLVADCSQRWDMRTGLEVPPPDDVEDPPPGYTAVVARGGNTRVST